MMGVINATPDSFSDGGRFLDPRAAVARGRELVAEGADILDVGGESTRPGAEPVSAAEELRRVLPVIEGLAACEPGARISIDTYKADVAAAALAAGASIVNDVTAMCGDAAMAQVIAGSGAECCLMHMQGDPRTMQREPRYEDVVAEVCAFLGERLGAALDAGIARERIMVDPGIGFGKTERHNLELLRRLEELTVLAAPIAIGTSRKGFIGRILGRTAAGGGTVGPGARLAGTIATNILAFERGASILRVHDVAPVREALAVTAATLGGRWTARGTETTAS